MESALRTSPSLIHCSRVSSITEDVLEGSCFASGKLVRRVGPVAGHEVTDVVDSDWLEAIQRTAGLGLLLRIGVPLECYSGPIAGDVRLHRFGGPLWKKKGW